MPINNQSVGKDLSVVVTTAGATLSLGDITAYEAKPQFERLTSRKLNGNTYSAGIPSGWEVTIGREREDSNWDVFLAQLESSYFDGNVIQSISGMETIAEPDGSTSQFQYTLGSIVDGDVGKWAGTGFVPQTLKLFFSRRLQVS